EQSITPPAASPSPKTGFENLEDEMASLLGRPKSPS
ncbi:MAG TPA: flagellar biosynthesis protein FliO, partial [Bradyrhizobium sp.]|nr:flagellar biosynthesis protein FliO [Bradyrhizobium sp.]